MNNIFSRKVTTSALIKVVPSTNNSYNKKSTAVIEIMSNVDILSDPRAHAQSISNPKIE